jgi:hypothetical protein
MPEEPPVQHHEVEVHAKPDPIWGASVPKGSAPWTIATTVGAAGLIFGLFAWNYVNQSAQSERILDKMQLMEDKREERRTREQEKEIARLDKLHEYNDTRLRDWIKAQGERQALEGDKVRLELKGVAEQMKFLNDRLRMKEMP